MESCDEYNQIHSAGSGDGHCAAGCNKRLPRDETAKGVRSASGDGPDAAGLADLVNEGAAALQFPAVYGRGIDCVVTDMEMPVMDATTDSRRI